MANMNIKTEKILSPSNIKKIIMLGISLKSGIESIEQDLIKEYDTTKTYSPDMAVYYNDYLYRCLFTTTGEFDINSWKKVGDSLELVNKAQVEAMLGLTPDELDTLANIILDSEVRLDKTWSSSKIYTDLQQCLNDSKTFTLQEFAKANKASYNVVSATSEMTDKSVIYLMSNNTNYDMYIVELDGTPTKIGDTTIDLSSYAKLSDLNNYYDKATSDGKYATITTVDGKVDKTSILSTISSTPSDDKLLSEKAIKSELDTINTNLDDKINKASITTTIGSTSTDTQVPSAKVVYDNIINKLDNTIVLTTADKANSFDRGYQSFIIYAPVADAIGLPGLPSSVWFCIHYSHAKGYKYPSQIAFEYAGLKRIMYRTSANGVWGTWQRVCTTSVADVPTTSITPTLPSTVKSGNNKVIRYSIKNGWANVTIVLNLITSPKFSWTSVATGLPKSDDTIYSVVSYGENGINNASVGFRLVSTGELQMLVGSEITKNDWWNLSFSYPVAES